MDSMNLTESTIFSYEHVLFFKKTFKDSEIIYKMPPSFQQARTASIPQPPRDKIALYSHGCGATSSLESQALARQSCRGWTLTRQSQRTQTHLELWSGAGTAEGLKDRASDQRDQSQALRANGICLVSFSAHLEEVTEVK